MNRFGNEKGVTLIELLTVTAISSVVLLTVYGVLTTGMNAYQTIGIDQKLRDEADYVIANILKELYEKPVDSVEKVEYDGSSCLSVRSTRTFQINENNRDVIEEKEDISNKGKLYCFSNEVTEIELDNGTEISRKRLTESGYSYGSSTVELGPNCQKNRSGTCQSGMIKIDLVITPNHSAASSSPIRLESQFRF